MFPCLQNKLPKCAEELCQSLKKPKPLLFIMCRGVQPARVSVFHVCMMPMEGGRE